MTNQQAVDFVRPKLLSGDKPARIAEATFDACISEDPRRTAGIGGDNMTCVIVDVRELVKGFPDDAPSADAVATPPPVPLS